MTFVQCLVQCLWATGKTHAVIGQRVCLQQIAYHIDQITCMSTKHDQETCTRNLYKKPVLKI